MKETLLERLQREVRERLAPNVEYFDPRFAEVADWAQELLNAFWKEQQKDLDTLIADVLKEASEELEGLKNTTASWNKMFDEVCSHQNDNNGAIYLHTVADIHEKLLLAFIADAQRLLGGDKT